MSRIIHWQNAGYSVRMKIRRPLLRDEGISHLLLPRIRSLCDERGRP